MTACFFLSLTVNQSNRQYCDEHCDNNCDNNAKLHKYIVLGLSTAALPCAANTLNMQQTAAYETILLKANKIHWLRGRI